MSRKMVVYEVGDVVTHKASNEKAVVTFAYTTDGVPTGYYDLSVGFKKTITKVYIEEVALQSVLGSVPERGLADKRIYALKSLIKDADRRAGKAERLRATDLDRVKGIEKTIREAKEEAGYSHNTSFDIVWRETLELAKERKKQMIVEAIPKPFKGMKLDEKHIFRRCWNAGRDHWISENDERGATTLDFDSWYTANLKPEDLPEGARVARNSDGEAVAIAYLTNPNKNGHVLITPSTCPCNNVDRECPVCDHGLEVCSLCGKGEVDLQDKCTGKKEESDS